MKVVVVLSCVCLRLIDQNKDIDTLIVLLGREVRPEHFDIELVLALDAHMLVSAIVMRPESIHLVEDLGQKFLDFVFDGNLLLENVEVVHLPPSLDIRHFLYHRVCLLHIRNQDLTDL